MFWLLYWSLFSTLHWLYEPENDFGIIIFNEFYQNYQEHFYSATMKFRTEPSESEKLEVELEKLPNLKLSKERLKTIDSHTFWELKTQKVPNLNVNMISNI